MTVNVVGGSVPSNENWVGLSLFLSSFNPSRFNFVGPSFQTWGEACKPTLSAAYKWSNLQHFKLVNTVCFPSLPESEFLHQASRQTRLVDLEFHLPSAGFAFDQLVDMLEIDLEDEIMDRLVWLGRVEVWVESEEDATVARERLAVKCTRASLKFMVRE